MGLDNLRIDSAELTAVCGDLVRLNTVNPPGNERAAAEYVAGYLGRAGFEIELVPIDERRASVLGRLKGSGEKSALVFNGHLDVVPVGAEGWTYQPFSGQVAHGSVWGRGASDMKGGVAAMLVAAKALAEAGVPLRGDLVVAATADEEDAMTGAQQIAASRLLGPVYAMIISEPTYNTIGLAERGVLWPEIITHGKTAHGSMPELGDNAIMMMIALLARLERMEIAFTPHPVLGKFTRSINTMEAGLLTNVVPDRCVATVDMRTVPGQDHPTIIGQIETLIEQLRREMPRFKASVRVLRDLPSVDTPSTDPAVLQFGAALSTATGHEPIHQTIRFATEAAVFVPALSIPAIICGPGDPALAHQPDEHVEIDRMVDAARIYALAAARMLG